MVKIAFISTTNSLNEISKLGDIEFCLGPFCRNEEYKKYFKDTHKFKILDNGIAENNLIPNDELVQIAIDINANEIIIPDKIGDYERTKVMRETFLDKYYMKLSTRGIRIQSVIQGKTLKEYEKCLHEISQDFRIDTIGIPFRMNYAQIYDKTKEENCMLNRMFFVKTFNFFKPIHFLGVNLPSEIKFLHYFKLVRSCDTKLLSRYGVNNKLFMFNDNEKPTKKLFINKDMSKQEIKVTIDNINKLKKELI